ncbi:MAG: hypothetical protein LBL39_03735 [Planctomycetaceae bacterium]|nr:hypothetical protein [Planctomycetaceae bacterium]
MNSPARGEMCITGGVAIAQPPDYSTPHSLKPRRGEIVKSEVFGSCNFTTSGDTSRPCRALLLGAFDPAVALRYTAGYAHHAPCGAKDVNRYQICIYFFSPCPLCPLWLIKYILY